MARSELTECELIVVMDLSSQNTSSQWYGSELTECEFVVVGSKLVICELEVVRSLSSQ